MQRLEYVCKLITDGSHNPPAGIEYSDFLMLSSKNIYNGKITFDEPRYLQEADFFKENKRTNVEGGDVLLTIVGTVGRTAVVSDTMRKFVLQRSVAVLKPIHEIVNSKYLMYSLINITPKLQQQSRGVAQKGIYLKQLKDIEIPLPTLDVQNNIAEILDETQEIIDVHKTQLKELDYLIEATFHEMFGDPVTNEKGWEIKLCKEAATKIGSGATPKGGNQSYKEFGISLIRSLNVYNGFFKYEDLAHIDEEQADKLKNVIVEKNDVLLNITGASVARSCIVPNDILPARVNQHVAIIRPIKDYINSLFLNCLFTNKSYQQKLWKVATGSGATREAITKQQIESLEIILPPLELQNKFADIVSKIEEQKTIVKQSITESQNLFNSLMSKYFD
ncbi:restriction endonuclease subunit S [Metabacillus malikii]|uniref:Type I restriction enzyme S subunit n=1 Tax=Metabacillus malikii TaxID=1504265 RepID=A0ABT9ZFA4_9BACI|nr:restriction endonuclease subunit S [Metabacillus malikii]MDQ0230933.1 type I restriction enzyme S subunit [Metabacillus malikii]